MDPAAIRRFLPHAAATWPRPPEARILVGDGTSNPHKYLGRNNANHSPPYVDFGSVAAAPSEILKLVLVEFATVYGNDWFTLPLDALPVGTLCAIQTVTVTDAFGAAILLAPFGDGAGTDWRMFDLAGQDGTADTGNLLLLLDALPAMLESTPAEEVLMLRDELASMAWAVEKIVESRTGQPRFWNRTIGPA